MKEESALSAIPTTSIHSSISPYLNPPSHRILYKLTLSTEPYWNRGQRKIRKLMLCLF